MNPLLLKRPSILPGGKPMRIAMLSPVAWRTPPRHYGPWENVVAMLTNGLIERGVEVTLFATGDSQTSAPLRSVCPHGYEEDPTLTPKVCECLHISSLFERAEEFDLIHNHFDFLPLTYSSMTTTPVVTTIHGFSSQDNIRVFEKYNDKGFYVSISQSDRASSLRYTATVHHGIDLEQFTFQPDPGDYLVFLGRFHEDKGVREAIEIARISGLKLYLAGIIQDEQYFQEQVEPFLMPGQVEYIGSVDPVQRDRLLGGARAMLHPIRFQEPFGLSVVESMACGTPVIAYNRGSMPELIRQGRDGFLVDTIDQAAEAVNHVLELDRRDCRKHVEDHFSAERMVDDYLEVYKKIIEQTARESHRPWGHYRVLADGEGFKSKEIVVRPGERLSLQRHQHRAEHWYILDGIAEATLNEHKYRLTPGEAIDIPRGGVHRIANIDESRLLRFIEIQTGDYFGEDDIERLEDDYQRIGN